MAIKVKANGKTFTFPDGTSNAEIGVAVDNYFSPQKADAIPDPVEPQSSQDGSILDDVIGGVETAASLATGIAAEPIAGLAGIAQAANPFSREGAGARAVEDVRDYLTYAPQTKEGQSQQQAIGDAISGIVEPLERFKDYLGEGTLQDTGSPLLATFASMIPDVILEVSGAGAARRSAKQAARSSTADDIKKAAISAIEQTDKETGVKQLTSDVFEPQTRLGNLVREQGEFVAGFQRKNQQADRVKAVENVINKYDVAEGVGFEAQIVKSLKDSVSESKKKIGELYTNSSSKLDQLGVVPMARTKELAQKVIDRESAKGTLANQAAIDDMQSLLDAPNDLSFEFVKEIRSGIGANLEKVKRGAPVQGNSDTGLLKRVYSSLTQDMKDFAEVADPDLAKDWRQADKVMSDFATSNSKTGAKAVIRNGDATPEVVDQLLFSNKNSDLEFLSSNLDEAGKQAAKQRMVQRMFEKSSIDGEDINPNKFLTQMNKERNRIGKFFDPEERKVLFAMRDVLSKTKRAQDAKVTTPTGQFAQLTAASLAPYLLLPGVAASIMETKPLRNLMIKRQSAKSARQRSIIDQQMINNINEKGLAGAAVTGATISSAQQQEQE